MSDWFPSQYSTNSSRRHIGIALVQLDKSIKRGVRGRRCPEFSRTDADDRLPSDPLGRIEGGDRLVERRDVADVGAQPTVTHPPHDLTQLGTIGLDDEVPRQA